MYRATRQHPAGCSKRPSDKAAASEEPRRHNLTRPPRAAGTGTFPIGIRRGSGRCENEAGGFFQHPADPPSIDSAYLAAHELTIGTDIAAS